MYRRLFSMCVVLSLVLLSIFLAQPKSTLAATSIQGLHVSGNRILNGANQQIRLLGFNQAGGEYMCVQGRGIWDAPADAASVQAMTTWAGNAVRLPLNEDCWLAINGVPASMSGATYQQAVIDYVNLLNSNGLIVILDLHWGAPGTTLADKQSPMPDADHSPAFWSSVANTFKGNSSVIFDLFNEPYPDNNSDTVAGWTCWRDGGTCSGVTYQVAGFQSLVNTVRATGATNIIMLGGLEYSNALTQWLTYKPTDSTGNLAASWHSYNFNLCANVVCWNKQVLPVIQSVPLIAGEIGENDCAHTYIDPLMDWLDSNNSSYLAWTWNPWTNGCATGPVLITDFAGTATAFGQGLKDHLAALKQNWTATPTNTWTPGGPTATFTRTFTPTFTATPTFTPVMNGGLKVQVVNNGLDNTQESDFGIKTTNTGTSAVSAVSFRLYFNADFGLAASTYVIDRYNEYVNGVSSTASTITGPTLAFGSTYYYTFTFGGTSIPAGDTWELTGRIRLSDWSTNNITSNDWYHSIFPTTYTDTIYIPAYLSSILAWGLEPGAGGGGPTGTPTRTMTPGGSTATNTPVPPTATRTPTQTIGASNTPIGPTATRTNTPVGPTATRTNTPPGPTNTPVSGSLIVQINKGNGIDNTQETGFNFLLKNTGVSAVSNLSTRIYFDTDGSNAGSGYVLEKYYDQSGVATYSGPTLACGSTYYFTVTYGTASLPAGGQWEIQTALHLSSWASTYSGANDFYHGGYAVGALPVSYTTTGNIPAYVSGTLTSGSTPSCGGPTSTNTAIVPTATRTPTQIVGASNTPVPSTATNTPVAPTATRTPTPTVGASNTPVSSTPTNTPIGPTNTPVPPTATRTNTPIVPTVTPGGSDPCASPTVITGSGSFAITTSATCFKYVNAANKWGAMWTVMNGSTTAANTLKWYGGLSETATSCVNNTQTLTGNGAQLNNFTVAKDSNGAMFLIVTGNAANTISMSVQNWQNGTGCSVAPTPHP